MVNYLLIALTAWTAAMVTVLVFKKPPATPDEVADNKIKDEILAKLAAIADDVQSTV